MYGASKFEVGMTSIAGATKIYTLADAPDQPLPGLPLLGLYGPTVTGAYAGLVWILRARRLMRALDTCL